MVVPKPLIGQTASEFLRLYPSANILVATERDFEKSRRKQFVSRIATGDYDCIIMSHSQFEKIPISAERKERMLNEQIDEISYAIDEMKERNGERWTVKQMESQKKKLEEQLKALSDESRKDDLITFEELGVDSIMVDEAHNFKNLAIFSKMNNVSGISSSGAKKSTDMQLKCQYLSEINDEALYLQQVHRYPIPCVRCMSCSFTYRKRHLKRWGFITLIHGQQTLVK